MQPKHVGPPTVDVRDLTVQYGPVQAVNQLTFTVHPGQVVGLLGGNGAGKSSTLRAIAGVNPPTSGTLLVAGHDMGSPSGSEHARQVTGYCPDVGGLIRQATVREHIGIALGSRDQLHRWPSALRLLDSLGLAAVLDRETAGFSHGMSRRLSVLLAVLTAQSVLILDEPFDGVDPVGVHATLSLIRAAADAGVAVIVSTHLLTLLTQASDQVIVMRHGTAVETGPAAWYAGDTGAARYEELLRHGHAPDGDA